MACKMGYEIQGLDPGLEKLWKIQGLDPGFLLTVNTNSGDSLWHGAKVACIQESSGGLLVATPDYKPAVPGSNPTHPTVACQSFHGRPSGIVFHCWLSSERRQRLLVHQRRLRNTNVYSSGRFSYISMFNFSLLSYLN
jgi:hypothetical protein